MPLLSSESASKAVEIMGSSKNDKDAVVILKKPEDMQLPIERLTPGFGAVYNRQACVFCEYFLHYVQQAITNPAAVVSKIFNFLFLATIIFTVTLPQLYINCYLRMKSKMLLTKLVTNYRAASMELA